MGTYHQLTEHQRYQIYALKKAGHDQQSIAATLAVSPLDDLSGVTAQSGAARLSSPSSSPARAGASAP